jgi:hypothetical protein
MQALPSKPVRRTTLADGRSRDVPATKISTSLLRRPTRQPLQSSIFTQNNAPCPHFTINEPPTSQAVITASLLKMEDGIGQI